MSLKMNIIQSTFWSTDYSLLDKVIVDVPSHGESMDSLQSMNVGLDLSQSEYAIIANGHIPILLCTIHVCMGGLCLQLYLQNLLNTK